MMDIIAWFIAWVLAIILCLAFFNASNKDD